MAPQPLNRITPNCAVNFDPRKLLNSPHITVYPMTVIATWAFIDDILARLLSQMMKSDLSIGLAMFQALKSQESQRSAVLGAAEKALPLDHFRLLQAIWKVTKPSRDRRHEYAHHLWGIPDSIPNALALLDPKDSLRDLAAEHEWQQAHEKRIEDLKEWDRWASIYHPYRPRPEPFNEPKPPVVDRSRIMIFRDNDLRDDERDARSALEHFANFQFAIRNNSPGDAIHQRLLVVPEIEQAFRALSDETPPSQPQSPQPKGPSGPQQ